MAEIVIKLPKIVQDWLVKLPEDGMGYQKVKVTLANGDVLDDCTIWNEEKLVINSDSVNGITYRDINALNVNYHVLFID